MSRLIEKIDSRWSDDIQMAEPLCYCRRCFCECYAPEEAENGICFDCQREEEEDAEGI